MKKKVVSLFDLSLLLVFGLSGCGSKTEVTSAASGSLPADSSKPSSVAPKVAHALTLSLPAGVEIQGEFKSGDNAVREALEGTEITLALTYDETLNALTVTSSQVTLNKVDEKTYTFTMPDEEVTVNVESQHIAQDFQVASIDYFSHTPENLYYFLYLPSEGDEDIQALAVGNTFKEGQTVTLGYKGLKENILDDSHDLALYVNDVPYVFTFTQEPESAYYILGEVSFVMPSEAVHLVVSPLNKEAGDEVEHKVTVHLPKTPGYHFYGIKDGGVYDRDQTQTFFVRKEDGYILKDVTYTTNEDSDPISVQKSYDGNYEIAYLASTVTDYTLAVAGEYTGVGQVIIDGGIQGFTVDGNLTATIGEGVNLKLKDGTKRVTKVTAKDAQGNDFEILGEYDSYSHYYTVTFTMTKEAGNITLYLTTLDSFPLAYDADPAIKEVQFMVGDYSWNATIADHAFPGDKVFVNVTPSDGYRVDKGYYTDTDEFTLINGSGSFTIPEDASSLHIHFDTSALYALNVAEDNKGKVEFNGLDSMYAEGDTVSFTVDVLAGFSLTGVSVKDATGKEVALTKNDVENKEFSFVMPASACTMEALGKEIPTAVLHFDAGMGLSSYTLVDADGHELKDGDKINKNTQGQLTLQMAYGFTLTGVFANGSALTLKEGSKDTYLFAVGDGDEINLTYNASQNAHGKILINPSMDGALDSYQILAKNPSTLLYFNTTIYDSKTGGQSIAYSGEVTEIRLFFNSEVYNLDTSAITIKDKDNNEIAFTNPAVTWEDFQLKIDLTMPADGDINISLPFTATGKKGISYVYDDQSSLNLSGGSKSAKAGDAVKFEMYDYSSSKNTYKIEVKTKGGEKVDFALTDYNDSTKTYPGDTITNDTGTMDVYLSFTMPDDDVIVNITVVHP